MLGRRAAARLLLCLVLLSLLAVSSGVECLVFHQIDYTTASRSRRYINVTFAAMTLLMVAMWAYSAHTDRKYLRKSSHMQRVRRSEELLVRILRKFSLKSVQEFHFHGIKQKVDTISVEFTDLRTTVQKGRSVMNGCREEPIKVLLAGVTGEFHPGRMAAIMGPSGAGKTTLLNVLCGKVRSGGGWEVAGSVLINGKEQDMAELKPVMGFVPQDDIVHEGMTVRENIRFSAEMRCPRATSRKRVNKIVEDVLNVLQLEAQQNLVVGNRATSSGALSGGQRKRVNIGLELAACPTLLFLDEPTSGLDATTSLLLCEMLKKMTDLGMTIVMVIHQPRYSLFTLIDDVLLLGRGGRTAYVGPTVGAKAYLERLGFQMPENENPADWMMDILSGQNITVENPDLPTKSLPDKLFEKWSENSADAVQVNSQGLPARGRVPFDSESQDVIKRKVKEEWEKLARDGGPLDEEAFTEFLQCCHGFDETDNADFSGIVEELMEQATDNPDADVVTQDEFVEFLLRFWRDNRRGAACDDDFEDDEDESAGSESGSEEERLVENGGGRPRKGASPDSGSPVASDMRRVQPGFSMHFKSVFHRGFLQWWRRMTLRMLFVGIIEFAALFLGLFDAVIFHSPPWMPTVLLNAHVSIALLVSVYSLACFSRDQPMYWREASHGLNRFAFMCARMCVETIDVCLICFFFTGSYYLIVAPQLNFEAYVLPFFLVSLVASGWGYLVSCVCPPILAPFAVAVLCFMVGGILGLPDKMSIFLDGGLLEFIAGAACFTRWSVPMDFLAYEACGRLDLNDYNATPYVEVQYKMYKEGYAQAHWQLGTSDSAPWYTGMFCLLVMAFALRLATYPALRFVNASKQL